MAKLDDLTGKIFGYLTVTAFSRSKNHQRRWNCTCKCGGATEATTAALNFGQVRSCGCLGKEIVLKRSTKHNQGKKGLETPTYSTWLAMRGRCRNKKNLNYKRYGGRGITVCSEWDEFENFYNDMGKKPKGKSLDRIDNNKGYSKENCRWSTPSEQVRNSTRALLKEHEVINIKLLIRNGKNDNYIAEIYKVGRHVINKIRNNVTWKDVRI